MVHADFEHVVSENRDLRKLLGSQLLRSEQLRKEAATHLLELNGCLARLKDAMALAISMKKTVVINFPKQEFTIQELEAANASVDRDEVRMQLAYRISQRQVEFFPDGPKDASLPPVLGNGQSISFLYRIAPEFDRELQAA